MISPASSSTAAMVPEVPSGATAASLRGPAETAAPSRAAPVREDAIAAAPPRPRAPSARTRAAAPALSRRSSAAGYAKSVSSSTKTGTTNTDPLAFLRDSKLSIDEKLMRLLSYMNSRWEKDMNKKLNEIGGGSASATSSGATSTAKASTGGSLLEKVVGTAKQFFPAVGFALDALKNPAIRGVAMKIGGPVLAAAATALGYPAIAPALLKYAPGVIDAAAGLATWIDGAVPGSSSKPAASGGGSSQTTATKGAEMSDSDRQLKLMEIQRIQEKQREMFQLVSNMLRSSHDLRMSIVGNLR